MGKQAQKRQIEYAFSVGFDILKDWFVVISIALSVAFLSYIGSYLFYEPTYTSSTTFVVSAKASSTGAYANLTEVQKLTDTFQSVMNSNILKKKVAESLGMDSFSGSVNISVVPETNLLTVSVTSGSPEIAFRELKGILDNYQSVAQDVFGEVVIEVFEEPAYPTAPDVRFDGKDVMKKMFALAFVAVAALIGVISFLKDTVKLEDEVTDKLDTTLFGALEHESLYRNTKAFLKRQKKQMLITDPDVSFGFRETMKKMRTKLMYLSRKKNCKVIMVTSTMRKEGKTTIACNLALSIAQKGDKVLLMEGNLRESKLADHLGIVMPEGYGMGEDLAHTDLAKAVYKVEDTGIYVLTNNARKTGTTEFLASRQFGMFLERMKKRMDYIIIDAPSSKGNADVEVLVRVVDASILVAKQNLAKVPFINDTIDMLNSNGDGLLGCVFNDVYTGGTLISSGYGYGYGKYYRTGKYGRYGRYDAYYQEFLKKKEETGVNNESADRLI